MCKANSSAAGELVLMPGGFYFGSRYETLKTLLGSCVAITMWHPERRIGGMCHFILPSRGAKRSLPLDGSYGDEAFEMFLRKVEEAGTSAAEYEIKLFGGCSVYKASQGGSLPRSVSCKNIEAARMLLSDQNLQVTAQDLGGLAPRHISFDVYSGIVLVKRV